MCACIFISQVTTRGEAHLELNAFRRKHDCALVISGDSLEVSQRVGHSPPATDFLCPVLCLIHHNRSWKWRLWLESHDQPPGAKLKVMLWWYRSTVEIRRVCVCLRWLICPVCSVFLQVCLKYYEYEFMELACQCPAVVCCRCTPTQKAQIVRLLQERTGKLTCAVGEQTRLSRGGEVGIGVEKVHTV